MTKNIYDFKVKNIKGEDKSLKDYEGKVLLIVNVASKCGFTPQYKELEEMHKELSEKGLCILGFPCNQFGAQEPGSEEDIQSFCSTNYGVTFTIAEKSKIKSNPASEIYEWLSSPELNGWNSALPSWNFCKYIIDEKGNLIKFFKSGVNPTSSDILGLL